MEGRGGPSEPSGAPENFDWLDEMSLAPPDRGEYGLTERAQIAPDASRRAPALPAKQAVREVDAGYGSATPPQYPNDFPSYPSDADEHREQVRAEIEALKRLLQNQEDATKNAVRTAMELSEQLSAARQNVEAAHSDIEQRIQWEDGQKSRVERAEASVSQIKAQWQMSQRDLEKERRERRAEVIAAARRSHELERKAEIVRVPEFRIPVLPRKRVWPKFARTIGVLTIVCCAVYFLGQFISGHRPAVLSADSSSSSNEKQIAALTPPPVADPSQSIKAIAPGRVAAAPPRPLSTAEQSDFSLALDRLNAALLSVPGLEPVEVLRRISIGVHAADCAFEWNGGHPVLRFGSAEGSSLARSLGRCAQAVERYR